jgi:hypothetical protein
MTQMPRPERISRPSPHEALNLNGVVILKYACLVDAYDCGHGLALGGFVRMQDQLRKLTRSEKRDFCFASQS